MIAIVRADPQGVVLRSSQPARIPEVKFHNTAAQLIGFPGGQLVKPQLINLLSDDMWMVRLSLHATRFCPSLLPPKIVFVGLHDLP